MLDFEGQNGSTDFFDWSNSRATLTSVGGAALSNADTVYGSTSFYLDGSNDYIEVTSGNAPFNFGTEDFTIEALTAFTPANAGKFTLQLAIDQN